ncbi:unnamed protein product [Coffea canephora]|uniref:DH200=94 genomic scaffold, scaffold_346 n=1 Tax=Coffea canephora TaxID=49390 RepID=A0A068VEE9_COFCA|nr:unnamed protein product [Coffea canephora]
MIRVVYGLRVVFSSHGTLFCRLIFLAAILYKAFSGPFSSCQRSLVAARVRSTSLRGGKRIIDAHH